MEITGLSSGISSSSFHPSSAYAISRGLTILPTLIEPTCSSLPWYQLHPLPAHSDYPCSHHTSLPLLPTLCSHPHSRHRHILASPITHTSPPPASLPLPMTSTNSWDNLPPHTCILSAHIVPCDIPPTTVPPVSLSLSAYTSYLPRLAMALLNPYLQHTPQLHYHLPCHIIYPASLHTTHPLPPTNSTLPD